MSKALIIKNLTKSYDTLKVLKGIDFEVSKGDIFALLGINGAGKTTTLECIEGIKKYEAGKIIVNGKIGVQIQSSSLPDNIKVNEAINLFAYWRSVKVDYNYLERIGVSKILNKQYSSLSTGQKQRVHIAVALLGDPDIIILDEPTAGLDIESRINIHNEIRNLKKSGKTIILSSHDMAEVESLCDKIAILNKGKIAFLGTPNELTDNIQNSFNLNIKFTNTPDFKTLPISYTYDKESYVFTTQNIEKTLLIVINHLKNQKSNICDIKVEQAGMEQRFIEISKEDI